MKAAPTSSPITAKATKRFAVDESSRVSAKAETFLANPALYPEHQHYVEARPRGAELFFSFHKYRTLALGVFVTAHYLGYSLLYCGSSQTGDKDAIACDPLALSSLRAHFNGSASVLQLAPLTVALAVSPFPLCCVGARTLSPLPLVVAWWLAYTRSVRDQWGAACGLWLALLITAWGMKAAAFAAAHVTAAAARAVPLRAWLRFQFLSPHLVWDAALPRRAPAPLRAAAEVAHAAPSFLVAHVVCLRYLAPAMRALAAAAAARDAAAGAVALAALAATCLPMRAVAFYGFWHCCGCALAYVSGEPDFNLYGPWWLVRDHPAPFFRHWSRPVHVWMRRCVYAPLRRRRTRPAVAAAAAFAVSSALHEAALLVALRSVWPISSVNLLLGAALTPVFAPLFGARAPAAFELLLHLGNVQFVAVTWRWWLAGFGGSGGSGGSGGGGDGA